MNTINEETLADLSMGIRWESGEGAHSENYHAGSVNFYRDHLPDGLLDRLMGKGVGDSVKLKLDKEELMGDVNTRYLFNVKRSQFDGRSGGMEEISPRVGRFYPRGRLRNVSGVFRQNIKPFRCVEVVNGHLTVDFNHPLAGREVQFHAPIEDVRPKKEERGGTSTHWLETVADGPGMQSRWNQLPTDFDPDHLGRRDDERSDALFYREPRLVQHIDDGAIDVIKGLYGRFVGNGTNVLDLMSSWQSHLPENVKPYRMTGLGLNESELKANPSLTDWQVHDLNENPVLPFETEQYDVALCTASIEYLIDPVTVTREVARVLKPDGLFIVTFSNRWFPTKAIKLWEKLHDFERMGLVMDHFIQSNLFVNLETYSMRGLPRPAHDKYAAEFLHSDPVFAVWGHRI